MSGLKHGEPLYDSRRDAENESFNACSLEDTRSPEHALLALLAAQSIEWGLRLLKTGKGRRADAIAFIALGLVEAYEEPGDSCRQWLRITSRGLALLHELNEDEKDLAI